MFQILHMWTCAYENFSRPVLGGLGLTYHTNSAAWSDIEFIVLMGCVLKDATSFCELACAHMSERKNSNLAHVNTYSHNLQQACTRRSTVEHQSLCQCITNGLALASCSLASASSQLTASHLQRTSRECLLARPPWNDQMLHRVSACLEVEASRNMEAKRHMPHPCFNTSMHHFIVCIRCFSLLMP